MSRNRGYLGRRRAHYIVEPREDVQRTEAEEARRATLDWLRDRDEDNTDEFEADDFEREPPDYAY